MLLTALNLEAAPAATNTFPAGKALSDAYIKQQIVGTWYLEEPIKPAGSHKLVITISADGTSSSRTIVALPKETNEWNYAGKWAIKDGICTTTLTKSRVKGGKSDPVGSVERSKILNVDSNQLVQAVGKQIITLKRKK